ncbi:MAG TPA: hypothetical protein DHV22_04250 [Xanthomarina gelatinilytica]|uniref:Uncharacterized protein n=1 Tax=Xanthomarina gelatinilytica TaxID=1137281 RepID=A0A3D6BPD2_9FLAO|nr:hypothetical protein [Xanthomarina gelatinilytica]
MNTDSIKQIREQRDKLSEKVKETSYSQFKDKTFGSESEYSYKGLMGGLKAMFTDITTLTKETRKFIKISSYGERTQMVNHLSQLNAYFSQPNTSQFITPYESLKKLLRDLNVRAFSERQIEFENEIDSITRLQLQVDQDLKKIRKLTASIKTQQEKIDAQFETQTEKLTQIDEAIEKITDQQSDLKIQADRYIDLIQKLAERDTKASEHLESITTSLNEAQSSEKLIKNFAQTVERRDKQLEEIEERATANDKALEDYELERKKILNEAKDLIASAKNALNYKTAEGISAAFQEQYVIAKDKWKSIPWLIVACAFVLIAIGLGIWVLSVPGTLNIIVGRISLIPIALLVAFFSGREYVKQKNIAEDYAYKMVLSKAIVGFSEQLKKHGTESNEEYIHYIKRALEEIHKDPLRSRSLNASRNSNNSIAEVVGAAERIIAITKGSSEF